MQTTPEQNHALLKYWPLALNLVALVWAAGALHTELRTLSATVAQLQQNQYTMQLATRDQALTGEKLALINHRLAVLENQTQPRRKVSTQ